MLRKYYIAEVGINHEGNLDKAIEYCKKAKEAGADAVKFQWVNADRAYEKGTESYEIFKDSYLTFEEMLVINYQCNKLKIDFFATPGDMETLYELAEINNKIVKISSGLATHRYLIREASKLFQNLIISTGTLYLEEIINLNTFLKSLNCDYSLLKCTSQYPSKDEDINLDAILYLREKLNINIGYSCHSIDILPSIIASSMGVEIIEKHFSLDTNRSGFDHAISINFEKTSELNYFLNRINLIKNWDGKLPSNLEINSRERMHRYLYPKRKLKVGHKINLKDFYFKRSNHKDKADFISAISSLDIEGQKIIKECESNKPLLREHIEHL